jgi:DNA polymerase bacteriophage-type
MIVHNCGYGLGPGKIEKDQEGNTVKTGLLGYADSMGVDLPIEYAQKAVMVFRNAYSEIVSFWYNLERAFVEVTLNGGVIELGPLVLEKKGRVVCIWLPSGRALHYINPEVTYEDAISNSGRQYKRTVITIDGVSQKTHQWERIPTRGPRLFENVVQAVCRDILAHGMIEADRRGFDIVLTCHDEIVAEVPENGELGVKELIEAMVVVPDWADGFLIDAAGFETDFYRKD